VSQPPHFRKSFESPINKPLLSPFSDKHFWRQLAIFSLTILAALLIFPSPQASLALPFAQIKSIVPAEDVPYVKAVLALNGDADQGEAIFQLNCAACHGVAAMGNVGPSLRSVANRRSAQSIIEQVISGNTPPMPQFQPDPQTMADLLNYLQSL
jgi:mono/diheme cytochrome c family protein